MVHIIAGDSWKIIVDISIKYIRLSLVSVEISYACTFLSVLVRLFFTSACEVVSIYKYNLKYNPSNIEIADFCFRSKFNIDFEKLMQANLLR